MANYKLVVFGANGKTGREVVRQALDMGYEVTAVVRNPASLPLRHERLLVRQGDVLDLVTIQELLRGQDAVISALGVAASKPTTVFSDGVGNIIKAMNMHRISRLMVVSALAVEINTSMPLWTKLFIKYVLQPILENIYSDMRKMEYMLTQAELAWTIVRPPRLTDKKMIKYYRVSVGGHLNSAAKISRADLAHYLLNHLNDEDTFRKTVEVAY